MFSEISDQTPEEVNELVDMWLWGFAEPQNWPTASDARSLLATLISRPDAHDPSIRAAVADCLDYIRSARRD